MSPTSLQRRPAMTALVAALALAAVLSGVGALDRPAAATASPPTLVYATNSSRTPGASLAGASLSGRVAIYAMAADALRVDFRIDDPGLSRAPYSSDSASPYDLAGTAASGGALLFDSGRLAQGLHLLTATVRDRWGTRTSTTVSFAVGTPTTTTTTQPPTTTTTKPPATTTTQPPTTTTTKPPTTTTQPPSSGSGVVPFPTPSTTGWAPTGVTLKPYTGPLTITANGTVIDGADIAGGLTVKANNVTISRSRIRAGNGLSYVVYQSPSSSGLSISDTEIANVPSQAADRAVSSKGTNMTLARVYVHGTQRGIETGPYTTITDSYSDDFMNTSSNHATGVMSLGGTAHVTLRHNTFGCGTGECSAAMSVYPQTDFGGANSDWTIDGNLFNGGSYCVYLGYSPADGESPNTNMRVTNNGFGTKYRSQCGLYGPVGSWSWSAGNTWTGNYWYAPGATKNGTALTP